MSSYDVLIIGPDTEIGKELIKKLQIVDKNMTIYVPAKKYKNFYHQFQIYMDERNTNSIKAAFQKFNVVIQCTPKITKELLQVSKTMIDIDYYNACITDIDAIIETLHNKLPMEIKHINIYEKLGFLNLFSHLKFHNFPHKACIYCESYNDVDYFLLFNNQLISILFWIFCQILCLVSFIFNRNLSASWNIDIITPELHVYKGSFRVISFDSAKADLALHYAIKSLRYRTTVVNFASIHINLLD